jgi:hypothetical protein
MGSGQFWNSKAIFTALNPNEGNHNGGRGNASIDRGYCKTMRNNFNLVSIN